MNNAQSPGARAEFFRELARLTAAGISITHAAKLLAHAGRAPAVRRAVAEMERGLADGNTIAGALEPSLNALEHSVIQASEESGRLAEGFRHLEDYYDLLKRTVARMRTAALYPLVMLHAAVILPSLVGAVLSGDNILLAMLRPLAVVWGVGLLAWLGYSFWTRRAAFSPMADRLLGRLPAVGPARRALALARWHTVMHFQVTGGQRISDGLRRAGLAAQGAVLNQASNSAATSVESGATLADALSAQPGFPQDAASTLAAAEYTGTLDAETLRLAREAMYLASVKTEHAAKWVCGAFYGAVMVFTAWQILKIAGSYVGMYTDFAKDLGL